MAELVGALDLDEVEAKLFHHGLETQEVQALITHLRALRKAFMQVVEDNTELEALFDLQHKREVECIERWKTEDPTGRALTLPDYGRLLDWMHARLLILESNNAEGASE